MKYAILGTDGERWLFIVQGDVEKAYAYDPGTGMIQSGILDNFLKNGGWSVSTAPNEVTDFLNDLYP